MDGRIGVDIVFSIPTFPDFASHHHPSVQHSEDRRGEDDTGGQIPILKSVDSIISIHMHGTKLTDPFSFHLFSFA